MSLQQEITDEDPRMTLADLARSMLGRGCLHSAPVLTFGDPNDPSRPKVTIELEVTILAGTIDGETRQLNKPRGDYGQSDDSKSAES